MDSPRQENPSGENDSPPEGLLNLDRLRGHGPNDGRGSRQGKTSNGLGGTNDDPAPR